MSQVYYLSPEKIIVPEDRIRKEFDKKKLNELIASLLDKGSLQPGICRKEGENFILIAGERRLRACTEAKIDFAFTLSEETNPVRIREIELEENLCRADLTFQETALAVEELHRLKQEIHGASIMGSPGGHGIADTADFLGKSVGNVSEEIELALWLDVDEVKNARTKTEAKKVIKRYREEYKQEVALEKARKSAASPGDNSSESSEQIFEKQVIYFSTRILNGKMEEVVPSLTQEKKFDVVMFDPPWGVDVTGVSITDGSKDSFEDSLEHMQKNLENWLSVLYTNMNDNSHLYMFFGIVNHQFVYDTLEKIGFETNRIPIIWHKHGAHVVRTPDIWPGRSYEPIAFARKGKKILVAKGLPDLIMTPTPGGLLRKSHPTAKHPNVYIDLLKRSCLPGDKVLDPMCGSGAFGVAAETLGPTHQLDWYMIEEKENFYNSSIANVISGYYTVTRTNMEGDESQESLVESILPVFVCYSCHSIANAESMPREKKTGKLICPACRKPGGHLMKEFPSDYKSIDSSDKVRGNDLWKAYWKLHPEKQEEMILWKNRTI